MGILQVVMHKKMIYILTALVFSPQWETEVSLIGKYEEGCEVL